MKLFVSGLCALLAVVLSVQEARADSIVVDFDDLTGSGTVSDGYGGINWGGVWIYYDSAQSPYTAHSGSTRIYNYPRTSPQSFEFVTPDQVFEGAWFSGPSNLAVVHFTLYNDGVQVHTSSTTSISGTPVWLASGYSGLVDEVFVHSSVGDYYVMDDVTYSAVPEPATLALFGLGAAGLALRRRKRSAA